MPFHRDDRSGRLVRPRAAVRPRRPRGRLLPTAATSARIAAATSTGGVPSRTLLPIRLVGLQQREGLLKPFARRG